MATPSIEAAGGEETAIVRSMPYSEDFEPTRAARLARAAAWLDGLERAGRELQSVKSVRFANLTSLQRQGLAALLGMVRTETLAPLIPAESPGFRTAAALAWLDTPDAATVSRMLAKTEERQRWEEVIVALRRVMPDILGPDALGPKALAEAEQRGANAGPDTRPDTRTDAGEDSPTAAKAVDTAEALTLYAEALIGVSDIWPPSSFETLQHAFELAPNAPLPGLAQAEIFLRQDRPQAALRVLADLREPTPDAVTETPKDPSGASPGILLDEAELAQAVEFLEVDRRIYVRGLRLRALAQLYSGQPALAEQDLAEAIRITPDQGELWLARGAVRQTRENFGSMCDDYLQACRLGLCGGLAAAREQGRCLASHNGE